MDLGRESKSETDQPLIRERNQGRMKKGSDHKEGPERLLEAPAKLCWMSLEMCSPIFNITSATLQDMQLLS